MSIPLNRMNFSPSIWGEATWKFMHLVALGYPEKPTKKDRQTYKAFFFNLGKVLPCDRCSNNYKDHWRKLNIDRYLNNPDDLFSWTVLVRNEVQKKIKKKKMYNPMTLKRHFMNLNRQYLIHQGSQGNTKKKVHRKTKTKKNNKSEQNTLSWVTNVTSFLSSI